MRRDQCPERDAGPAAAGNKRNRQKTMDNGRTSVPGEPGKARRGEGRGPSPRVLLVDDDPTTRNLIAHFLRKEDLIVAKASGGGEGMARARSDRPDLLILDAAVPGLDAFELLALLRREPETRGLPVLMLSSIEDEELIVKSLDAGADYIVKPFSPRILVAKVKKILRDAQDHVVDHRPL